MYVIFLLLNTEKPREDCWMNQPSNASFMIKLTVILVFFAMLCFPIALMAIDGADETQMESEAVVNLSAPTAQTYFDGSFQKNFENWFSAHYPLRSDIVKGYKQAVYDMENSMVISTLMQLLDGSYGTSNDTPSTPPIEIPPDIVGPGNQPTTDPSDTPANPDDVTDDPAQGGDTPAEQPSEDPTQDPTQDPGVDPGEDPTDRPSADPENPMAIYTDPSNIYAYMNYMQLLETPVEPTYKGNTRVYVGKSGYLFEASYINEYLGYTAPYNEVTREGVITTVEKLQYIQDELKKRGIEMLFVLSSSKAAAYADYIPDYYKRMYQTPAGYVRPVEMLREELAHSTVNYLDSAEYWKEIGLLNTFPKTGIHWNAPASFESTAKLVLMYQALSGEKTVTLRAKDVLYHEDAPSPFNNEKDVYKILYGAIAPDNAIEDPYYYSPDVEVLNAGAKKLNVLLQGGSFAGSINHYLENYGVANVDYIYYNGLSSHGTISASSPWDNGPEAWGYWLQGRDLVIFECTEQQVRGAHYDGSKTWAQVAADGNYGHNAVYDSLYEYLKAHEGEY